MSSSIVSQSGTNSSLEADNTLEPTGNLVQENISLDRLNPSDRNRASQILVSLEDDAEQMKKKMRCVRLYIDALPDETSTISTFRYSVDSDSLFPVNRTVPLQLLRSLHNKNEVLVKDGKYKILIMCDVEGMGKKTFVNMYSHFQGGNVSIGSFQRFKQIALRLNTPLLAGDPANMCDVWLRTALIQTLEGITGESLAEVSFKLAEFYRSGILLVLHGIGETFRDTTKSLEDQRCVFSLFCAQLATTLRNMKQVRILLVGDAGMLPLLPADNDAAFSVVPITLNMIRADYITQILDNTYKSDSRGVMVTLSEFYGGMNDSGEKKKVIDSVMNSTNGHPKSMLTMFRKCNTVADLENWRVCNQVPNVREWQLKLITQQTAIRVLIAAFLKKEKIDLTRPTSPNSVTTYAAIANTAYIRWEGPMDSARLHISDSVKCHLMALFSGFRMLLASVDISGSIVRLCHDGNMEDFVCGRWIEMFTDPVCPGQEYPQWFRGSQFGLLTDYLVSETLVGIPKVCDSGKKEYAGLSDDTVTRENLSKLLGDMLRKSPSTFIPRPLSSSSDIIFISKLKDGRTVFVGIAVKCYQSAVLTSMIDDEKRKFEQMARFTSSRVTRRKPHLSNLNVLIVVSTGGYEKKLMPTGSRKSHIMPAEGSIHETILLDLSTSSNRVDFFGLDDLPTLAENIESTVMKTPPSPERLTFVNN